MFLYIIFLWDVSRSFSNKFKVLLNLSWKLFKDNSCKLCPIFSNCSEFNKLNKIPFCFLSFRTYHLTVIIIKLVHNIKISISNPNNDNTDGKSIALDEKIDNLIFIMDVTICQNEQNHILIFLSILFEFSAHFHTLLQ